MAFYECKVGGSGGGIPPQLQTDMDSVFNKKLGTSTTYPSNSWAKEVNLMGLLPEKTVSGSVASFPDGADDVPIKTATFNIAPTLVGVSAVNVVRTGKNLFNPSTVFTATGSYMYAKSIFPKNTNLICKFVDKDPTVDISGIYFGFYDDTYTSGAVVAGHYRWLISNGSVLTNMSNLDQTNNTILCNGLIAYPKNQTTIDTLLARYDIQVEVGTVSTDYVAYVTPETRTISLGSTVYGGSVTVDEDGECDLDDTATEQILRGSNFTNFSNGTNCAYGLLPSGWEDWAKKTGGSALAFSHGQATSRSDIDNVTDGFFCGDTTSNNQLYLFVKINGCNDLASVRAAIEAAFEANTPMKVVYELATPTTSTLTPITPITSALGVNNIWCDTGDVESLTYRQSNALPTEQVLTDGQVSTLSDYATANYTKSVDGFEMITIRLKDTVNGVYYEDIQTFKVSSIGSGISVNFNVHTTVSCTVTKTSIAAYSYGGAWQNIYADVVALSDSIFDN